MTDDLPIRSPRAAWSGLATAFVRRGRALAIVGLVVVALTAWLSAGLHAGLAVLAGWLVAGAGFEVLQRGLSVLLLAGARRGAGSWALAALVPLHAVLAITLFVLVGPLAAPPAWLLAGVTAWPFALALAAAASFSPAARLPQ